MTLQHKRIGYIEGVLSILLNTTLFLLKLWVGRESGSVAIIADAWHTLSDSVTSFVVIAGFWLASRPGDQEHPFGHGRAEVIAAVIIGTLLGIVGFTFLRESFVQIREQSAASFGTATIVVFAASLLVKEGMAQFAIRAGRRVGSRAMVADGWHHRTDAIASALILVGALLGGSIWWIDGALGIAVSALILYAAVDIIRDAVNPLLGEQPARELSATLRRLVTECCGEISDIHHIHVHRYGEHVEVTLHARLPSGMTLAAAHEVATGLEERIRTELGMEPTIHVEPQP